METELKIAQLATLMGISTHQIRYFEEKGIFYPARIGDNGYRMYGVYEIYQMLFILLMRDLDIPVSAIKTLISTEDETLYEKTLTQKIIEIDAQIEHLTALKETIQQRMDDLSKDQAPLHKISTATLDSNPLKVLYSAPHDHVLSAMDIYHIHMRYSQYNLLNTIHVFDETHYHVCVSEPKHSDFVLKAGTYIINHEHVRDMTVAKKKVAAFIKNLARKKYVTDGPLCIQEMYQISPQNEPVITIKMMMRITHETR